MIKEPLIDTDKIQGNILPGFRMPYQKMIACKVKTDSDFIGFIKYLLPQITSMRETLSYQEERIFLAKKNKIFGKESFLLPEKKDIFWVNIGLGRNLVRLYNTDVSILDNSFNLGLAARSFHLGDPKENDNEGNKNNWKFGNDDREAEIFLITASDNKNALEISTANLETIISNFKIEILYSEIGERLDEDKEHFGFKDGVSQPESRGCIGTNNNYFSKRTITLGNENDSAPEYSTPDKQLLWTGQFVFGYPKQSPNHFREPIEATDIEKSDFIKNGSFLVFRRLKQNVKSFYDETKKWYEQIKLTSGFENLSHEDFIEKLVGRKKDGTPLVSESATSDFSNNFNFKSDTNNFILKNGENVLPNSADPQGIKCPMFAHIRKVNPRDIPTDQGAETNTATFRIMRRGIPFGKPYNFSDINDPVNKEDRGLLFLCYQTSIQNQFELLTNKWMNKDSRPESVVGHDMLVGQNNEEDSENLKWCLFSANENQKRIETKESFVIPTGGGYFFFPSIDALKLISNEVYV